MSNQPVSDRAVGLQGGAGGNPAPPCPIQSCPRRTRGPRSGCPDPYRYGEVVAESDEEFLRDLITRHPDYEEKAGAGVGGFVVVRTEWNNRGLVLVRIDGSEIDISWQECLRATPHAQQVRGCLRRAIKDQVITHVTEAFRHGPVVCEVTGDSVSSPQQADVDHCQPAFEELAQSFIQENGGLEAFVIAPDHAAGFSVAELENPALVRDWQEYHRKHATLRVVTRHANRSILRRKIRDE
ncbi:DUF3223 domain-containing protein [Streptomyces xanthophaeus]|uniref:DUF3223 domain-containing protein n=1 Tax=Streptomyces xanthophaeus TaxID=67385 RepID=UPI002649BF1B|nr:DUF3223 domain-containing protein [Streptomyces xanthophaeus]WKD35911.1 DCL family protein [Streptomyces xanthophaeus]